MTNSQLTDQKLTKIIESAEAVISALAGTNDDVHPDDSTKMCRQWDALNDNDAPPEVVLVMAKELQERRKADSELVEMEAHYHQLSELYHAQEKRLFKIAQRIKGASFDKYSHSPSQAIDVLEVAIFGEDEACRVAILAAAPLEKSVNDVTAGKPLTITLPDISSKAFWSGAGKNETFHPETYRRWAKEAIERACIIASIDAEVR